MVELVWAGGDGVGGSGGVGVVDGGSGGGDGADDPSLVSPLVPGGIADGRLWPESAIVRAVVDDNNCDGSAAFLPAGRRKENITHSQPRTCSSHCRWRWWWCWRCWLCASDREAVDYVTLLYLLDVLERVLRLGQVSVEDDQDELTHFTGKHTDVDYSVQ